MPVKSWTPEYTHFKVKEHTFKILKCETLSKKEKIKVMVWSVLGICGLYYKTSAKNKGKDTQMCIDCLPLKVFVANKQVQRMCYIWV